MAKANAREQLVSLLERKAFNPVLQAKPDSYSDADREKLETVQDKTRTEVERFRNYGSAQEVVTNFKRDLHSEPAKRVHRQLEHLNLPTIHDVRDEFEELTERLEVDA